MTDRYQVMYIPDAIESGVRVEWDDSHWCLVDTATEPPTYVWDDGMAPEDAILVRDISGLVVLLNEKEQQLATATNRVADLERERDELRQELKARRVVDDEVAHRGYGDGSIGVDIDADGTMRFGAFMCGNFSLCDDDWYPDYPSIADQLRPGWRDE